MFLLLSATDLDVLLEYTKLFGIAILNGKWNKEKKKKAHWRASFKEVQQGFLLHAIVSRVILKDSCTPTVKLL